MIERPYFSENSDAMNELEAMVDKAGLRNVLWALEHICYAKSSHVRENWQDNALAKEWDCDARRCARFAKIASN